MWQIYIAVGTLVLFSVVLTLFARSQRKLGASEIKQQVAEKAADNAIKISDIAVNDKPSDANQRLRNGVF